MPDQPTIKVIETSYAGCRFRSRLEARHGVFFDTLGVRWEYEPEGFLVDGRPYLPDFWLPDLKRWVEVKGDPSGLDVTLLKRFAFEANVQILILGPIPAPSIAVPAWINLMGWPEIMAWELPEGDPPLAWQQAVVVSRAFFNDDGRISMGSADAPEIDAPMTAWISPEDDEYTRPQRAVSRAYAAARSARFEHGRRG